MLIIEAFHGSNAKFTKFSRKEKRIDNDFYGGGIAYFTDSQKIALNYARSMQRKYGGEQYLYKVKLTFRKIFDVDSLFHYSDLRHLFSALKVEDFLRGAGKLGGGGFEDKYEIVSRFEMDKLELTGKEVFKGLSKGMINSQVAEKALIKLGYDGLRYNGGENMGMEHHNVYIPYNQDQITILNSFYVKREVLKESILIPEIGYMTFSRELLPQITDQSGFLEHIGAMDVDMEELNINPNDIKASQLDGFDLDKVGEMMVSNAPKDPVIISSDDYILDGHHRWLAAINAGEPLAAIKVDLPILELIKIGLDYTNSNLVESVLDEGVYNKSMTNVLYHHADVNKGIDMLKNDHMLAKFTHSIPYIHKKSTTKIYNDGTDDRYSVEDVPSREIKGNSLTRNIHLAFSAADKRIIFEFDRDKLQEKYKIYVIDADLTAGNLSPHKKDLTKYNELARNRAVNTYKKFVHDVVPPHLQDRGQHELLRSGYYGYGEFAEEFVEGDITNLHKYLVAIWLKDDLTKIYDVRFYDLLGKYIIDYNIPLYYYPSGKDATNDLIDALDKIVDKMTLSYSKKEQKILRNIDFGKTRPTKVNDYTKIMVGIRGSINKTKKL